MQTKLLIWLVLISAIVCHGQTTAFTYQGRLNTNGVPATGAFDFQFALRDAVTLGNNIGSTQFVAAVSVSNGLFTVSLDFGALAFDGSGRWLEIGARSAGGGPYSLLAPRQQITSTPYAALALRASTYTGTIQTTNLTGTIPDTRLSTNVALLNTNVNFTGTVKGALFSGDGTGLTNVPGRIFEVIPTGTNIQAFPNYGFLCTNDSAAVVVTLPASIRIGETIRVAGSGAGGWFIAQNAGQSVLCGQLARSVGLSWQTHDSSRAWRGIASSADGSKLVAVVNNGQIYTSTNYGVTWTPRDSVRAWRAVASSADGVKLVAVVNGGQIYTSANSGVSWTARDSARNWTSVASSLDGVKLFATVNTGLIYTSTDSGTSWNGRDSSRNWTSIACSGNGSNAVAGVQTGNIYTSTNNGANWTPRDSSRAWNSVASSGDGNSLVASVSSGQLYISRDYGVTWTTTGPAGLSLWTSVASSADGSRLGAVINSGGLYVSEDAGLSWTARPVPALAWQSIASSNDGSTLAAVATSNPIYVSSQSETTVGTAGGLAGPRLSAVELEYIGNGRFIPVSYVGNIRPR